MIKFDALQLTLSISAMLVPLALWQLSSGRRSRRSEASAHALLEACQKGQVAEALALLAQGADPCPIDANGCSTLHLAAYCPGDHAELVRALADALPADYIDRPIAGNASSAGTTALHLAAISGNADVARFLVESCLSAGREGSVHVANADGQTALLIACCNSQTQVCAALLEVGVFLSPPRSDCLLVTDGKARGPLYYASRNGDEAAVAMLLDAARCGADSERAQQRATALLAAKDSCGYTPLHAACICQHVGTARLLLQAGAAPDAASSDGCTPLMGAVRQRSGDPLAALALFRLLTAEAHGAALTATDTFGQTILHFACGSGGVPLNAAIACAIAGSTEAQLLLAAQDNDGATPMHCLCHAAATAPVGACGPPPPARTERLPEARTEDVLAVAGALLAAGGQPDCLDFGQTTPLMQLAWGQETEAGRALLGRLLEAGADARLESAQGWSVLHVLHFQRGRKAEREEKQKQKVKDNEEGEEKEEERAPCCYASMETQVRLSLEASAAGAAYLLAFDPCKPRDLSNRAYLDNCGAHNRIPLAQRSAVLQGDHSLQGVGHYVQRFRAEHGRPPRKP